MKCIENPPTRLKFDLKSRVKAASEYYQLVLNILSVA